MPFPCRLNPTHSHTSRDSKLEWYGSGMEIKVPPFTVKHTLKTVTIEVCISLPHNANSACPLNNGPMWRLLPSWQFDVQKDGAEVESKYPAPVPKVSWRRQAKHLLPNPLPWAHQTSLLPPTLYMFPQIFLAATSLVQVSLCLLFQQDFQPSTICQV